MIRFDFECTKYCLLVGFVDHQRSNRHHLVQKTYSQRHLLKISIKLLKTIYRISSSTLVSTKNISLELNGSLREIVHACIIGGIESVCAGAQKRNNKASCDRDLP